MKPELEKQLLEKYPKIFSDKYGKNLSIGDGWYNLVESLCYLIQSRINNSVEQFKFDTEYNNMIAALKNGNDSVAEEYLHFLSDIYRKKRIEELRLEKPREVEEIIPQVVAVQVKEKFGGLRFYITGGNDFIYGAISLAESLSFRTCEECGAPGTTKGSVGWIQVLCQTHREEKNAEMIRRELDFTQNKEDTV